MTERARYIFNVKYYPEGQPWICMEPLDSSISPLKEGFIGFDLADGTTQEQAIEIAAYLDSKLLRVTYTGG
jgi:hypothetical protein